MEPNSISALDVAHHLHAYTNLRSHREEGPLVIDRGEGIYVIDENGKRYIEGLSGLWCTALGFSEQRLVEAAARQLRRLPYNHTFRGRTHETTAELSARLVRLSPVPVSKVFFASSGSEANDSAIRLIWYYNHARGKPRKRKIIARWNGYHGTTIATASLSGMASAHQDCNLPIADVLHTDCPHFYRNGGPGETEARYLDRLAANLESLIEQEGADTIAAFIAEPVMGVGGVLVPPVGYFERVQEILRRNDILIIADEIICGFGRTGNMWGSQTFGLQPDIVVCAKALSSAYMPISAILVPDRIFEGLITESDKLGVLPHGFTYSGHPVAAAVALEALKIYEERDIVGRVRYLAPLFQDRLRRLSDRAIVGEVRGVGLMAGVELVRDKSSKASFDSKLAVGAFLAKQAMEHGLIVRAVGDSIVMAPPLIITESEIEDFLARFDKALTQTEAKFA
jgi:4-aminobutyrate---pyruvate transaminase